MIYLIPFEFTGDGKVPLSYRVIKRRKDRRTTFCKQHERHEVDPVYLLSESTKHHMAMKVKSKDLAVLNAPNGALAYRFYKEVYR